MIGPRPRIQQYVPWQQGHGTSYMWRREIGTNLYQFTLVFMPNGEMRYVVRMFNGYIGGTGYDCAWDRIKSFTIN